LFTLACTLLNMVGRSSGSSPGLIDPCEKGLFSELVDNAWL